MHEKLNMHSEGDLNIGPRRNEWIEKNITPQTRKLLDQDKACFLHQSLSTPCLNVIDRCEGPYIIDHSGKKILDFHGNNVHHLGFGHTAIVQAITEQMHRLSFCPRRYTNEPTIRLATKLTEISPLLKRVLFAPGGAEAVGMALKIARMATGRFKTISMWESFHGASLDAISVGGEAIFRKDIGPLLPGTEHAPPPDPSGCPFQCSASCSLQCADYVEYMLEKEGDVAAVVSETIRSSPFIPPKEYWLKIREACDRHGALLILDEIPHALGRTGRMFTFQHYGIEPDMVVIGKGLGGGIFPLAAVLARDELNEAVKDRAVGHYTHEKSPVASAAALALIETIEKDELLLHVDKMYHFAINRMRELQSDHKIVHDVRALGLIMGIELRDPETGQKAMDEAEQVMYKGLELGLNFKLSMGNILNLAPPINIQKEELEVAFSMIDEALSSL